MLERRRGCRRAPARDEALARVRLRAGRELIVLDVSTGGILVEGKVRLLPGTHLDVHVMTSDGRLLVRSRVVRAYVSELTVDSITYRGALAFDQPIDVERDEYAIPKPARTTEVAEGTAYPERAA